MVLPGDRFEILSINLVESIEGTNEPAHDHRGGRRCVMTSTVLAGLLLRQPFQASQPVPLRG